MLRSKVTSGASERSVLDETASKVHHPALAVAGAPVPWYKTAFGVDKRTAALYRVALGITLLFDLYHRGLDLRAHYTDEGVLPRYAVLEYFSSSYWFSLHLMNGTVTFTQCIWLFHACLALCLMIGYRTRLMTVLCWLMCLSLQVRNELVLHSGDVYMRVQLFIAMFVSLGDYYSVDSVLRQEEEERTGEIPYDPNPHPTHHADGGTFLMVCQIGIMYTISAYHKYGDDWTKTGEVVYYSLALDFFRKWPVGDWMLLLPRRMLQLMCFAVWYWEKYGPLLLFFPVAIGPARTLASVGFTVMHFMFGMCMRLAMFTFITMTGAVWPLPGWAWDEVILRFLRYYFRPQTIAIRYEANRPRLQRWMRIFATFFLLPETVVYAHMSVDRTRDERERTDDRADIEAAVERGRRTEGAAVVVVDKTRQVTCAGYDAMLAVMAVSPLLFVAGAVLRIKIVRALVSGVAAAAWFCWDFLNEFAEIVTGNPILGVDVPTHAPRTAPASRAAPSTQVTTWRVAEALWWLTRNTLLVLLAISIIQFNVANINPNYQPSEPVLQFFYMTQLGQEWSMFSPNSPTNDFYFIIKARLMDNTVVELFRDEGLFRFEGAPMTWAAPDPHYKSFKNHRWYKYFEAYTWGQGFQDINIIRLNIGRYVCREWNSKHRGPKQLFIFQWWIIETETQPEDIWKKEFARYVTWDHQCYDNRPDEYPEGPLIGDVPEPLIDEALGFVYPGPDGQLPVPAEDKEEGAPAEGAEGEAEGEVEGDAQVEGKAEEVGKEEPTEEEKGHDDEEGESENADEYKEGAKDGPPQDKDALPKDW